MVKTLARAARTIRSCVVLALFIGATVSATAAELRIASGSYPPLTDPNALGGGEVNRIVTDLAAAAGFQVTIDYMPWKRALELTRLGRYHASSVWYYDEARTSDFIHVGPLLNDALVFFRLTTTEVPAWSALQDLSSFRIGAVPGYTLTPELWQLAEEGVLSVQLAPSDATNFRKLLAGRIDLYPIGERTGWSVINENFSPEERARFTTVTKPLVSNQLFLLVSRAAQDAETIAEALQSRLTTHVAHSGAATAVASP